LRGRDRQKKSLCIRGAPLWHFRGGCFEVTLFLEVAFLRSIFRLYGNHTACVAAHIETDRLPQSFAKNQAFVAKLVFTRQAGPQTNGHVTVEFQADVGGWVGG
jgi:hypothetical protein